LDLNEEELSSMHKKYDDKKLNYPDWFVKFEQINFDWSQNSQNNTGSFIH
jgi:hypothetical protein